MHSGIEPSPNLSIIGMGPGGREQMTLQSAKAIAAADFVVGYKPYLELIADLLNGKEVISSSMGREVERARIAVDLLDEGSVALISSGDPNIYGMAGLGLEMASRRSVLEKVEVVPGITAFAVAACQAGIVFKEAVAVISLSDLLTPWANIEEKLKLAAECRIPVALYNPRSKRRNWQLARTLEIYGENIEVLVARNIGRDGEYMLRATTDMLLEDGALMDTIDMFTTIIISGKGIEKGDCSSQSPISIVGIGPGAPDQLTFKAERLLMGSAKVFGAERYLQGLRGVFWGEPIVHQGDCAQRMTIRLNEAKEASKKGQKASILTGGDPSIFSSSWRLLQESKSNHPLNICSGVSAFSSVAAKAGAPLVNDFILLSQPKYGNDLRGLIGAGFAVIIYNVAADDLQSLLNQVPSDRPCVLARDVTRDDESVLVLPASELLEAKYNGRRFTLLISSSSSYIREGKIITRRGYQTKYSY